MIKSPKFVVVSTLLLILTAGSLSKIFGGNVGLPKLPSPRSHREATVLASGPFKGIDPSKLDYETGAMILAANFDFVSLRDGKEPLFAVAEGSILQDGGSQVYAGKGYQIIRLQSISTFGKLTGHSIGVRLIFDEEFSKGGNREFAETRFLKGNWKLP